MPDNEFFIPGLTLTKPLHPVGNMAAGDADPLCRLSGQMEICGASFFVEAEEVRMAPDPAGGECQESASPEQVEHLSDLGNMVGGDGPFETIEIPGLPGRRYVLYMFPFCE